MDSRPLILIPPPTDIEWADLAKAYRSHIDEGTYAQNPNWYNYWGLRLIAIRRSYQRRFINEASSDAR